MSGEPIIIDITYKTKAEINKMLGYMKKQGFTLLTANGPIIKEVRGDKRTCFMFSK